MARHQEETLTPSQLNAEGQVVDEKILNRDRYRIGLGNVLFQSEELGLGPVPLAIIKSMGGDDRHIGILGGFGSAAMVGQLFGNFFLRWKQSNRKAMVAAMWTGFFLASGLAVMVLAGSATTSARMLFLNSFLVLILVFGALGGVQLNIEAGWIGDLVPENRRGWFTKIKWIMSLFAMVVFQLLIARMVDRYPNQHCYAGIFLMFAVSFLVAGFFIYSRITDRVPKPANFLSAGASHHERIHYTDPVYLLTLLQGGLWMAGRGTFLSFTAIFLVEEYHFTWTQIALTGVVQSLSAIAIISLIGNKTDRWNRRKALMVIMTIVGLAMGMWIGSAWVGIPIIIAFYVVNGTDRATSLVTVLFLLDTYPAKGRAAYIGVYKLVTGIFGTFAVFLAGFVLHHFREVRVTFLNVEFSRYHALFMACMLISLSALVPLYFIRNRTVKAE